MSNINDGGAAFPFQLWDITHSGPSPREFVDGMSLRAYFAGQAMQGLLSMQSHPNIDPRRSNGEKLAKAAIAYADELIKGLGL